MNSIVIVGSGLAGITVARELRKLDAQTPIVIVTADDGAFYSKPNLSNALVAGKSAEQLVATPRAALAAQLQADIRAFTRVTAIDSAAQVLRTAAGDIAYGKLVLALGAQPIRLPLQGSGADDVLAVNNLADYAQFRDKLAGKRRVAIIGAGLIGCEFANDLAATGHAVAVFDVAPQPLGRLLPPQAAAYFRRGLEAAGVDFHLAANLQRVDRHGEGYALTTADDATVAADLVLSAVGLRPETTLAAAAGLPVQRGLVADRLLAVAANIYAVGDCVEVAGINLPFVMPIMAQARALAKTLSGTPSELTYTAMPVVVKTPACATVVCPPPPGSEGAWDEEVTAEGVRARFVSSAGTLRGFALLGAATRERQALATQVPPLLA